MSAATAVLVVLSGALVLPGQLAAASAGETDPTPLTEAQQALAEAEKSGQRVEVTGECTDRTTTFANPDGFTLTLEQSVVPVRVSKPGGGWQKPDATLEKRAQRLLKLFTTGPGGAETHDLWQGHVESVE
ncbi:hypothetical protein [Streptomyces sp. FL07-04A]|uniref:hypothetical protein n=1 Tax=Streptomyces sp. FL07-04A TaxID=3028658 RepID=UPI0039F6BB80